VDSQVIPLRIEKEILEINDQLVELGIFNSRNEALRELIKAGIKSYENFLE
jgi:Arc/MetJ-type ribon-helix-helix transcriptional regulator